MGASWNAPGVSGCPAAIDAGRSAEPLAAAGTVYGRETRVKVGSDYVPARWAVVDADEAGVAMSKGEGQYRDRTRAASDVRIQGIARNIDFDELYWSPLDRKRPTLTRDGTIVGGNGRMAAIRQAYDLLRARRTRSHCVNASRASSGSTRRGARHEEAGRFVCSNGTSTRARLRLPERGRHAAHVGTGTGEGRRGAPGARGFLLSDDGRLDIPENRGAVRRWVEQFPDSERAALMDARGSLSSEGVMRLRNAASTTPSATLLRWRAWSIRPTRVWAACPRR